LRQKHRPKIIAGNHPEYSANGPDAKRQSRKSPHRQDFDSRDDDADDGNDIAGMDILIDGRTGGDAGADQKQCRQNHNGNRVVNDLPGYDEDQDRQQRQFVAVQREQARQCLPQTIARLKNRRQQGDDSIGNKYGTKAVQRAAPREAKKVAHGVGVERRVEDGFGVGCLRLILKLDGFFGL